MRKEVVLSLVAAGLLPLWAEPIVGADALRQQQQFVPPQKPQREIPQFLETSPTEEIELDVADEQSSQKIDVEEQEKEPLPTKEERELKKETVEIKEKITSSDFEMPIIKRFEYVGNEIVDDGDLSYLTNYYEGRELNAKTILSAVHEVGMTYKARGFKDTHAYVFSDSVEDGVVVVSIRNRERETLLNDANLIKPQTPLKEIVKPLPGVLVREFRFRGNESISSSALRKQISINEGRTHDTASLLAQADAITKYYESKGFKKAKAYIYKPDISEDGVVTITIRASGHEEIMQDSNLLTLQNPLPKKDLTPPLLEAPVLEEKEQEIENEEQEPLHVKETKVEKKQITMQVQSFVFEGVSVYKEEELLELLKPYIAKELSFDDLKAVTSVITKKYRKDGYFVALAYIPPQTIEDKVVKIAVIEGKIGAFHVQNSSLVKDEVIQAIFDEAKKEQAINSNAIERAMLLVNDNSGVYVTQADVAPGQEVGESDFTVITEASQKYDGYAVADNYGSRYTGRERVNVGANINSLLGYGDKLSLSTMLTNEIGIMNFGANYSALAHPNGLRVNVFASYTEYELSKELKALESLGHAINVGLGLEYPFVRSRLENLKGFTNLAYRDLKDEIQAVDSTIQKNLVALTTGLRYDLNKDIQGVATQSFVEVSYTLGSLNFKDEEDRLIDKRGANTQGVYNKINITLKETLDFRNNITAIGSLHAQYALANKNLDGSEDMSVGGGYGVRAFPVAELNAENGFVATLEGKYNLPTYHKLIHNAFVFYDIGKVSMANSNVPLESRTLQDIGVGYYGAYENFFSKLDFAKVVGPSRVQSEPEYSYRFLYQLGYSW